MNLERIAALAKKYLMRKAHAERETGFIYAHGQRVASGVIELRRRVTDDASHDDLLRCAAMFHDVGKGIGEHGQTGAEMVRFLLKDELTPDEIEEVSRLVYAHNHRAPGTGKWDLWAQLLQDADIIDHYGTVEVWLNFQYCAHTDRQMTEDLSFYSDEFPAQTEKHRALLNFEEAKRVYDERVQFNKAFAARMAVEAEGGYMV